MATQKHSNVLRLVPPQHAATVAALRAMLVRAEQGRLVGLAWVEFMPSRSYHVESVGTADTDPTYTRGCVRALDDIFRERVDADGNAAPDFEP